MSRSPARLRWRRILGPWPLQPWGAAVAAWLFTISFTLGRLSLAPELATGPYVLQIVILAPIPGVCVFVTMQALRRYWPACERNGWAYAAAMLIGGFVIYLSREAIGLTPASGLVPGPGTFIGGMMRSTSLVIVIQSLLGVTGRRLSAVADQRRVAMELAQEQQGLLLGADERIRRQVSSLLHDRVQAGLVAACLELRETSSEVPSGAQESIRQVIERLERMRTVDVRPAARALSPDLVDSDLHVALEELTGQYAPAMAIDIAVDPSLIRIDSRPQDDVLLGCYRVVEQALLNSAVHGRAQRCRVAIQKAPGAIRITVDDDGIGMPPNPRSGVGTALTTTRMRLLNGTWARVNRPNGGVSLWAQIPL